ncbi:MAG: PASTA domain-containing protein [Bacteroidia bacterium]|nr:PASTA domain-containing protein [Bacteroidia bacterium]
MCAKSKNKNFIGNNILLNIVAIGVVAILLVVLTLLLLNVYTRHGQNVIVPQLQGLQAEEAEAMLKSKGLDIQIVDSIFQRDAVPGSIIDQTPKPNNKVKEGRDIYITIYARNPQPVSVPGLIDFSSRQAIALLNSIGFNQITIEEVPAQYHGLVMSVEYRGKKLMPDEQIPAGSPLKLVVGSGMTNDSLDMNREFVVSPAEVRTTPQSDPNGEATQPSNIDESFF